MAGATQRVLAVAMLLLVAIGVGRVDGAKRRQQRQRRAVESRTGPTEDQIWDSGLMEKELSYATLLEKGREYYSDTQARRFKGFVLGYVTPWNKAGYANAITFRDKLDAVSPVWFQIKQEKGKERPEVTGSHEVNDTWMSELKQGGKGPLVVPRFILEADPEGHVELLRNGQVLLEEMVTLVLGHGFDGMVLEAWSAWHSMNGLAHPQFKQLVMTLIESLGKMLRESGKKLFLAVPPPYPVNEKSPWLDRNDLIELSKQVDGLTAMTYDFGLSSGQAGPNSPLPWIDNNLQLLEKGSGKDDPPLPDAARKAFLMGVNFYGWDYSNTGRGGVAAVTADGLERLLHKYEPALRWEEGAEEHSFDYNDKSGNEHQVWYPTPRSLELRVQAAKNAGVGLSIWELGQGVERFFDLL